MTSATDEKEYDGTALTNDKVTISGDGLADKDYIEVDVTGSQTYIGSSDNTFTYEIREEEPDGVLDAIGRVLGLLGDAFADEDGKAFLGRPLKAVPVLCSALVPFPLAPIANF